MKRSRHRVAAALVALVAIAAVMAGCGGDVELSTDASARLEELVRAARDSAAESDVDGATNHLETLRVRVAELQEAGEVSEARARSILAAVEKVDALLEADPEPVEPEEPTGPATDDDEHDHADDNDDEHDHADDDEDDGKDKVKDEDRGKDADRGSGRGKGKDDD